MSNKPEELLTTDDVVTRYKIPKQTQAIYREKHGLPFVKPAKRIYYFKKQFDQWLKEFSVN